MVAEGVEPYLAYAKLKRMRCDQGQGFLISSPVPIASLDYWYAPAAMSISPTHSPPRLSAVALG